MNDLSSRPLREALSIGAALVVPGVSNALAARVVADLGYSAAYVTGAGIANSYLGMPDNGLVTVTELVDHVMAIRDIFPGHLIVDADTGFGNAMNVVRTMRSLERAGANAIQLEDQVFPKRCGHFDGKELVSKEEMVAKIAAAADTRHSPDCLIIARTDAIAVEGFSAAIDRASAYREAGADVSFVEAPTSMDQLAEIPRLLPWPQVINVVIGGRTPKPTNDKLKSLGYAMALYANVALQSAVHGMQVALGRLRTAGKVGDPTGFLVDFAERQRLVDKDKFDEMERIYSSTAAAPVRSHA